MKPDVARRCTGAEVLYTAHHGAPPQHGRITGVGAFPNSLVAVCLDEQTESRVIPAAKLEFFHVLTAPVKMHRQTSSAPGRCLEPNCKRRHEWEIDCSCGRQFWRYTARKVKACAEAHQAGQEGAELKAELKLEPQP